MTIAPAAALDPPIRLRSRRGLGYAALAAGSVLATSTTGRIVTAPGVKGWYRTIAKPWFNPPNWVFPVAWSLLFVLMGVAFYRVLRAPAAMPWRRVAIVCFLAQLVMNVSWSLSFFGAHSPLLGLIVVVPFWLMIFATQQAFWRIDRAAGWLLVPYLAWVAFATVLNAAILAMN